MRCSNCHIGMQQHKDNHGLTTWNRDSNGEVTVNIGTFLPVKTFVCPSCGKLKLQVDQNALSQ